MCTDKNQYLLIYLLIFIAAFFAVFGIDRSPFIWVDEVFYAEPARQLYLHNSLVSPIFFNVKDLDSAFFLHPPVYFFIQSKIFNIFGFSQMAARLPGIVYYLLSVFIIYLTIMNLLKSRQNSRLWALLGSACFAFDKTILEEIRSGRSGSLAILMMVFSFYILNRQGINLYLKIFLSTLLGGLAALTHPTASFLVFGYFMNVMFNKSYSEVRLKAIGLFCFAISIVFVPYLVTILANFETWQSQFLTHSRGAIGGMSDKISVIISNFVNEFKFKPFILICILLSFLSPYKKDFASVLIPFFGISILGIVSNLSFYKFILPIAYVSTFTLLPSVKERLFADGFKTYAFKLMIIICMINYLMFPLTRTLNTHLQYQDRNPSNIGNVIEKYIPVNSKVLSVPASYYACIKRNIDFKYPGPLYGLRIEKDEIDILTYQLAVKKYKPDFLIIDSNINPEVEYGYLSNASYVYLFRHKIDLWNKLNPYTSGVDFNIWKVNYSN